MLYVNVCIYAAIIKWNYKYWKLMINNNRDRSKDYINLQSLNYYFYDRIDHMPILNCDHIEWYNMISIVVCVPINGNNISTINFVKVVFDVNISG